MTAGTVAETVGRLRQFGVELTLAPPDRIRWKALGPLPDEARAILDELRAHRSEVLAALTAPAEWDEERERGRLGAAFDRCDGEAAATGSWADAWDHCRRHRPDLVAAVDDALDALDAAFKAKDPATNIEACRALHRAVQAAGQAYLAVVRSGAVSATEEGTP